MNEKSKFPVRCYVDPFVRTLQEGSYLQFERRGYYKVDIIRTQENGDYFYELIYIPDGKKKGLASIDRQTDIKGDIKRLDLDEKVENKKKVGQQK